MRSLAWILGILALSGSIFVGISQLVARHGTAKAVRSYSTFEKNLAALREEHAMELRHLEAQVENGELGVRNADLGVEIAEETGRGARQAAIEKQKADAFLDGYRLELNLETDPLGPDPDEEAVSERMNSAKQSAAVYANILERDSPLGYLVVLVWIAFGFAAALSTPPGTESRESSSLQS
jgi:hypothetical protein